MRHRLIYKKILHIGHKWACISSHGQITLKRLLPETTASTWDFLYCRQRRHLYNGGEHLKYYLTSPRRAALTTNSIGTQSALGEDAEDRLDTRTILMYWGEILEGPMSSKSRLGSARFNYRAEYRNFYNACTQYTLRHREIGKCPEPARAGSGQLGATS
jgi:hypothetical protein